MNVLELLVIVAALATVVSLASGIASMAYDGEVGHYNSAQWMVWRVAFQAVAFLLILFALFVSS